MNTSELFEYKLVEFICSVTELKDTYWYILYAIDGYKIIYSTTKTAFNQGTAINFKPIWFTADFVKCF